mgnify:CR=1 FL=1
MLFKANLSLKPYTIDIISPHLLQKVMSNLDLNLIVLLVLLACGISSHNSAVTIAAGVLIVFRITPLSEFFPYLQQHGLNIGIIIESFIIRIEK